MLHHAAAHCLTPGMNRHAVSDAAKRYHKHGCGDTCAGFFRDGWLVRLNKKGEPVDYVDDREPRRGSDGQRHGADAVPGPEGLMHKPARVF